MNINFEINNYLEAFLKNETLDKEEKIANFAKTNLQFKYGNINFEKFSSTYSTKGWLERKFKALPAAIWSGLIKTIYRLAITFLMGIKNGYFTNLPYLKAQFFHIARNLQEAFGWLATLVNDKYGQYHIQESRFHHTCYQHFLSNHKKDLFNIPFQHILSNNSYFPPTHISFDSQEKMEFFKLEAKKFGVPEVCLSASGEKDLTLYLNRAEIIALGTLSPELTRYFPTIDWDMPTAYKGLSTEEKKIEEALIVEAEEALKNSSLQTVKENWEHLKTLNHKDKLSYIFSHHKGLGIGEAHDEYGSKKFLIDHIDHLKSCGVDVLFIEQLACDGLQCLLDEYFDKSDTQMPPLLESVLSALDEEHHLNKTTNYTHLIKAAKKAGIRIVCIETTASRKAGLLSSIGREAVIDALYKRHIGMNYISNKIIQYAAKNKKFVILMGNTHGPSVTFNSSEADSAKPVPGLAPLLGIPFIAIRDREGAETISYNIENFNEEIQSASLFGFFTFTQKHDYINMKIEGYH